MRLCTDPEGVIDALKIKIKNAKTPERHRALKRGSDMMFSFVSLRIATQLYIYNILTDPLHWVFVVCLNKEL